MVLQPVIMILFGVLLTIMDCDGLWCITFLKIIQLLLGTSFNFWLYDFHWILHTSCSYLLGAEQVTSFCAFETFTWNSTVTQHSTCCTTCNLRVICKASPLIHHTNSSCIKLSQGVHSISIDGFIFFSGEIMSLS